MSKEVNFNELKDKVITSIVGLEKLSGEVHFICSDGSRYKMFHKQDCCESVNVEDIIGDVQNILDSPILLAEVSESGEPKPTGDWEESWTWTFYKLATIKGYVDIRWFGSSNGYYSESVSFKKLGGDEDE